jgi:hypothetical protein
MRHLFELGSDKIVIIEYFPKMVINPDFEQAYQNLIAEKHKAHSELLNISAALSIAVGDKAPPLFRDEETAKKILTEIDETIAEMNGTLMPMELDMKTVYVSVVQVLNPSSPVQWPHSVCTAVSFDELQLIQQAIEDLKRTVARTMTRSFRSQPSLEPQQ